MADSAPGEALPRRLLVGGVHAGGSGYPNAAQTLTLLESGLGLKYVECGTWLPQETALWRISRSGAAARIYHAARIVGGNFLSVVRTLCHSRRGPAVVYVPYPAIPFLWLMSWVPRRVRPTLIADFYISLWDSWVRDRALRHSETWFATWLKRIEGRAARTADRLLTDTEANAEFLAKTFALDRSRVCSLPLAIDEDRFTRLPIRPHPPGAPHTVLFVGTMIPLHGVDTILDAIRLIPPTSGLRFRLIGDGQMGYQIDRFLSESGRGDVSWIRGWRSLDDLAMEISAADVCLGIFGGTPKSTRVLPFKIYMYLAAGRATISQSACSLPEGAPPPPLVKIPPRDPAALAAAIRFLLENDSLRLELGEKGRTYFLHHLGREAILGRWKNILAAEARSAP